LHEVVPLRDIALEERTEAAYGGTMRHQELLEAGVILCAPHALVGAGDD
jgi:hypothetical protein